MSDVLVKVNPFIVKQDTAMRNAITPEARIAATLRSLATGRSYEDLKFALWIREPGSGPPTHVRANSEPVASRAPPKALASPSGLGRARLVAPHTQTSLALWNPSRAALASQTLTYMDTLRHEPS
jgi:hypothetical protein